MNTLLALILLAQITGPGPLPGQPPPPPSVEAQPATSQGVAQGTPAEPQGPHLRDNAQGSIWTTLIFFAVMILVFWLLIIRPQQKQRKKQEEFLAALKPGDRVMTSGGLVGKITSISGPTVTLEVAKDVRVQVIKGHIAGYFAEEGEKKAS